MEILKLLSANEIVAQVLSFLILLALLRVFVWKRVLGLLDKRKEKISLEFKNIEEARSQAERLKSDYLLKISSIEEEASRRMRQALDESKLILEEARRSANIQAQGIIENAQKSVQYELAKAKDELKAEIIDLTLKATENIIKEKLTADSDRRLVKEFLEEVDRLE